MVTVGVIVHDVSPHVPTPKLLIAPAVVSVGLALMLNYRFPGAEKTFLSVPAAVNTIEYGLVAVVRSMSSAILI